tara:strand:+ start:214 stop:1266 length:1053 start_codon:yes stop_codon:yes gene_type:complete
MLKDWIKKDVFNQPPYKVKTIPYQIKLNQNESPWDWPIDIKKNICESIIANDWNRYPSLIPIQLKKKIAGINNIDKNAVVIGNGSNEILQAIFTASIHPKDKVVVLSPTFAIYKMLAEQKEAIFIESKLNSKFEINPSDILSKSRNAKLTIICNPNSPTGSILPLKLIEKIAKNSSGLVVVDEAYVDFSNVTAVNLLSSNKNLIVTRTFSKAFALAGFRIGYGLMHNDLGLEIQKCLLPFNVDSPSLIALNTLLDFPKIVQNRAKKICLERDRITSKINTISGFKAFKSYSNFFLVSYKNYPEKVFNYCADNGVLIRNLSSYKELKNYNRITVGTSHENNTLMRILEEMP